MRIPDGAEATAHHLDPFSGRVTTHTLWANVVGAFRLLHRTEPLANQAAATNRQRGDPVSNA